MLYKIVSRFAEIRADESEEIAGLDLVEHGERGYAAAVFTGAPSFAVSEPETAAKLQHDVVW